MTGIEPIHTDFSASWFDRILPTERHHSGTRGIPNYGKVAPTYHFFDRVNSWWGRTFLVLPVYFFNFPSVWDVLRIIVIQPFPNLTFPMKISPTEWLQIWYTYDPIRNSVNQKLGTSCPSDALMQCMAQSCLNPRKISQFEAPIFRLFEHEDYLPIQ